MTEEDYKQEIERLEEVIQNLTEHIAELEKRNSEEEEKD